MIVSRRSGPDFYARLASVCIPPMSTVRRAALQGVQHTLPLFVAAVPFGLVLGVAIAETAVPDLAGWLSSSLIFGGAAQLAAITLLGSGAPASSALAAALVVNARHLMYSAALVPKFRGQPAWFRRLGPYVLIDQVFALSTVREGSPAEWRAYYLGSGLFAWFFWQVTVAAGIFLGPVIPAGLSLEFAIPVLFIGLVVPTLVRKPLVAAALSAVAVTALFSGLPNRSGMLIGGVAGAMVGTMMERRAR